LPFNEIEDPMMIQ
jgi:serine/threonine protein kinase